VTARKAVGDATQNVLIVGIGNPDCGDDGIGALVLRDLRGQVPAGTTLAARTGDVLDLIEDWVGYQAVILVDAATGNAEPGHIHRIDLLNDTLPASLARASTHAFGVGEAIGLARPLGFLPNRVIIYAIEGANFDPGAAMSPKVIEAARILVGRVIAEALTMFDNPADARAEA